MNNWFLQEQIYSDLLNLIDEDTQIEFCKEWAFNIEYINNPSIKVKIAAIATDGLAINYIANPSDELKKIAVIQSGCVIQDLNNPSEEIQLIAINNIAIDEEWVFFKYCLNKITSIYALNTLYHKTISNNYKIMIKSSPHWKDDASLILKSIKNN